MQMMTGAIHTVPVVLSAGNHGLHLQIRMLRGRMGFIVAMLIVGCLSIGCQTGVSAQSKSGLSKPLVWPKMPYQPRIQFVASISNKSDWERYISGKEGLFADESNKTLFPKSVAVDGHGNLFVSHKDGITRFNAAKGTVEYPPYTMVKRPFGIVTDAEGKIFIADSVLKKIIVYSGNRPLYTIGRESEFANPTGLTVDDRRKRLFVVDSERHAVRVYNTEQGAFLFSIESSPEKQEDRNFWKPSQAAIDSLGNIYIIDQMGCKINVYDAQGAYLRSFGGLGVTPGKFSRPKGIAVDSEDHIYVTDAAFSNFQIFDPLGNVMLFVGTAGQGPGKFEMPSLMYIDCHDRIYIADRGNHRIQIFQYISDSGKKAEC